MSARLAAVVVLAAGTASAGHPQDAIDHPTDTHITLVAGLWHDDDLVPGTGWHLYHFTPDADGPIAFQMRAAPDNRGLWAYLRIVDTSAHNQAGPASPTARPTCARSSSTPCAGMTTTSSRRRSNLPSSGAASPRPHAAGTPSPPCRCTSPSPPSRRPLTTRRARSGGRGQRRGGGLAQALEHHGYRRRAIGEASRTK